VQYERARQEEFSKDLKQSMVRTEVMMRELGVTDPSQAEKNGTQYCKKDKKGGCEPILLTLDQVKAREKELLEKSLKNSNKDQSQTSAEREQITIDYLREIATHIAFLNKTMSMQSEMVAKEANMANLAAEIEQKTAESLEYKANKNLIDQQVKNIKNPTLTVDKFGFPITKNKSSNNASSSL